MSTSYFSAFFQILAMFIAGVFFSGYLGSNIPVFIVTAIIFSAVFFDFSYLKTDKRVIIPVIAGIVAFSLGILYFCAYSNIFFKKTEKYEKFYTETLSGTVTDNINSDHSRQRFVIKTKEGVRVCVRSTDGEEVLPGDMVEISNPYIEKVNRDNHFFSDNINLISERVSYYASYKEADLKITGQDSAYKIRRIFYKIRKNSFYSLLKFFDYDEAAFAYSLISSDKAYISSDIYNKLVNSGLLHLCTVSGFHFSFLCMFLVFITAGFIKSYRPRLIIVLLGISVFVLYTGFFPSVMRAYFMFCVVKICDLLFFESISQKGSFIICVVLFLIGNPFLIYDASFILTFSALAGLILFSYIFGERIINRNFFGKKYTSCALSLNAVMIPICYSLFGRVSLWGFVTNFFAETVIAVIMVFVILIVLLAKIFPFIGYLLAPFGEILLKYIFKIISVPKAKINPELPFSFSVISAILVVFVLYFLLKCLCEEKKRIRFFVSSILCLLLTVITYASLNSDNAYIVYMGNTNGVDVIHKNSHYIICNTDDLSTSPSRLPFKTNNRIKTLVIMDTTEESEDKIKEFTDTYIVEKIYVREKLYSRLSSDFKAYVSVISEKPYNDGRIKISDKGGIEFEIHKKRFIISPDIRYTAFEAKKQKDATIILTDYGNTKYRQLLSRLEFHHSINPVVRSDGYSNLICTSDYSMITVTDREENKK